MWISHGWHLDLMWPACKYRTAGYMHVSGCHVDLIRLDDLVSRG